MKNSHYRTSKSQASCSWQGKKGQQCPSPVPNSALHSSPYTICPSPLMATISHLDSSHTQSFFSHHKENWQKFPCPSQALLHLRVSNEGGQRVDLTYSSSNSILKRSGHPTRSSHSCPEQQVFLKAFKEVTQSTFCLYKVSLLTKTLPTKLSHQCSYFIMRNSQEIV